MKIVILDRDGVINEDSPDDIKSLADPCPSPDWLVATKTRKPDWHSRAIASRLPGTGRHSANDLM